MLTVNVTDEGFSSNLKISERLFEQVGNTVVKVICIPPSPKSVSAIADEICKYMTSFMPEGLEVKNSLVILSQNTSSDSSGKYVCLLYTSPSPRDS